MQSAFSEAFTEAMSESCIVYSQVATEAQAKVEDATVCWMSDRLSIGDCRQDCYFEDKISTEAIVIKVVLKVANGR